jgi:hypothetical protein
MHEPMNVKFDFNNSVTLQVDVLRDQFFSACKTDLVGAALSVVDLITFNVTEKLD